MKKDIEAKKQGDRVVISRPAAEKRLAELANKKGARTQAEVSEEILIRLRRIEKHLGIE